MVHSTSDPLVERSFIVVPEWLSVLSFINKHDILPVIRAIIRTTDSLAPGFTEAVLSVALAILMSRTYRWYLVYSYGVLVVNIGFHTLASPWHGFPIFRDWEWESERENFVGVQPNLFVQISKFRIQKHQVWHQAQFRQAVVVILDFGLVGLAPCYVAFRFAVLNFLIFLIKSWKTSAVSTTVWMVETKLCKLRGTSDTFV